MTPSSAKRAEQKAKDVVHEVAPWVEGLARSGYVAKGIVYALVGFLAAQAAFDAGVWATGATGALLTILRQPLGQLLVSVLVVGFLGYALWRLVQALLDPEHRGTDARALATRAGLGIAALIYIALSYEAARLVIGSPTREDITGAQQWATLVMSQPLGRLVLGLVGLGTLGFGVYELFKAYKTDMGELLDLTGLDVNARRWVARLARVGYISRGIVFGIIGIFLTAAALDYEPDEARGVGGALRTLEAQPYSVWLLATVAAGLIAYGLYQLIKARYRRIHPG